MAAVRPFNGRIAAGAVFDIAGAVGAVGAFARLRSDWATGAGAFFGRLGSITGSIRGALRFNGATAQPLEGLAATFHPDFGGARVAGGAMGATDGVGAADGVGAVDGVGETWLWWL